MMIQMIAYLNVAVIQNVIWRAVQKIKDLKQSFWKNIEDLKLIQQGEKILQEKETSIKTGGLRPSERFIYQGFAI